jgi:hypothetical protein
MENKTNKVIAVFRCAGQTGPDTYENWLETVILNENDTIAKLLEAMAKRKVMFCEITIPSEK